MDHMEKYGRCGLDSKWIYEFGTEMNSCGWLTKTCIIALSCDTKRITSIFNTFLQITQNRNQVYQILNAQCDCFDWLIL